MSPEPSAYGRANNIPMILPDCLKVPQHFDTSSMKPMSQLSSTFVGRLIMEVVRKFVHMVLVYNRVEESYNIQATWQGSDQTAHMRRLV